MCDGDLMPNAFTYGPDDSLITCGQMDHNVSMGNVDFECNSTDMEIARLHCCENYVAPESN